MAVREPRCTRKEEAIGWQLERRGGLTVRDRRRSVRSWSRRGVDEENLKRDDGLGVRAGGVDWYRKRRRLVITGRPGGVGWL